MTEPRERDPEPQRPDGVPPDPAPSPAATPNTLEAANVDRPLEAELSQRPRSSPALVGALGLATVLFVVTLAPIAAPTLLGALLGAAAMPLYKRLVRYVPSSSIAAGLVTLALVLLVLVPLGVITTLVIASLNNFIASEHGQALFSGRYLHDFLEAHPSWARFVPRNLPATIAEQLGSAVRWAGQAAPALFAGVTNIVIGLFLAVLTTYFVLRDGPSLYAHLERTLPLEARHTRAIANEFSQVGRSFFIGTLGTAALQGFAGAVGYAVLGVPQPILLGTLTGLGAMIPMLGSGIVWAPVALVLIATGSTTKGIALIIFGVVVVSSIDNVVRPLLQRGGSDIHPLFFFLAIFGGLAAFGAAGLYMGPLFVSLFVAVARIYETEIAGPVQAEVAQNSRWRLIIQRLSRRG